MNNTSVSMDIFLSQTKGIPILTRAQAIELGKRKDAGDIDARNALVEHNTRLVLVVMKERGMVPYNPERFDAMYSLGLEGLIEAADRWDWKRGVKFNSYANCRIWRMLLKGLNEFRSPLSLPWSQLKASRLKSAPISQETVADVRGAMNTSHFLPLDYECDESEETIGSFVADPRSGREFREVDNADEAEWLDIVMMDRLTPREIRAIRMYYWEDATLDDVGDDLACSREGARQIIDTALSSLRKKLTGKSETADHTLDPEDEPQIGDWVRGRNKSRNGVRTEGEVFNFNISCGRPILMVRRADGGISKMRPYNVDIIDKPYEVSP